jgi:quercetin 2,3-dioxygenase
MEIRRIKKIFKSRPTLEGAGVHLNRVFGFNEIPLFDPFLMMDDFSNNDPKKYMRGFPWHPHRGIETITYILEGSVEHGDSMGNTGVISSGDVQWMTAGNGIIHQEMPKNTGTGKMTGFQLWANLPAAKKMMPPRYQDIKSTAIPETVTENGTRIKIICGMVNGTQGPVTDIIIDPEYLDITVPANQEYIHPTKPGYTAFAYLFGGSACFDDENKNLIESGNVILFDDGEEVHIKAGNAPARMLFLSGKPLAEPIAWGGPIVMNTNEELQLAFDEYQNGTFINS